jgi:predicted transcriptional regulator of viral defense system
MSRSFIENSQTLFEIAESQYGLFTAKQAIEAGFKKNNHPYHVRSGNWVREWHGIYRLVRFPQHKDSELVLWLLWSHNRSGKPQGVYSHETALRIFDLSDFMPAKLHLTVPKDFRKQPPKCLVLHNTEVPESDITVTEGLRVTTPLRTLLDLITTHTVSWDILRQALSESLQQGLIMPHQIREIKNNTRFDKPASPVQKLLELVNKIE